MLRLIASKSNYEQSIISWLCSTWQRHFNLEIDHNDHEHEDEVLMQKILNIEINM
ncbi:hypothetical protein ACHAXM_001802 [Skeletonema potamos]